MSSFIKARVLQDRIRGLEDSNSSVKNGSLVAIELGPPPLQEDARGLLEDKHRAGKRNDN